MSTKGIRSLPSKPRLVVWFSCGDASAVTVKLCQARYGITHEIRIVRCVIVDEHPDNDRFAADCEAWFGARIWNITSLEYDSAEDVWEKRGYMAGPAGAPCTHYLKRHQRKAFEIEWKPTQQAFGYTAEERHRADQFRENEPAIELLTPLIDSGLTKNDCHAIVSGAGIKLPEMYSLGFENNNCIGCVKASSPTYWNRVRRHFPDVFERRSTLSRQLGKRLVQVNQNGERTRIFLDELDPDLGRDDKEPSLDCSLLCMIAEDEINE